MRYLIVALLCSVCAFGAHADNNNTATSKDYVDAQIATLQDEIPAIDLNTVLTHTGTSGEIGSKKIYDPNSDYASQQNALVTAGIFNTAVQNAIDSEFVCIERQNGNGACLLYRIKAMGGYPNIADLSAAHAYRGTLDVNNGVYQFVPTYFLDSQKGFSFLCPVPVGNKVYIDAQYSTQGKYRIGPCLNENVGYFHQGAPLLASGQNMRFERIYTATDGRSGYVGVRAWTTDENNSFTLNNIKVYDLTTIFGAGNEPATAAEARNALSEIYLPSGE